MDLRPLLEAPSSKSALYSTRSDRPGFLYRLWVAPSPPGPLCAPPTRSATLWQDRPSSPPRTSWTPFVGASATRFPRDADCERAIYGEINPESDTLDA